MRGSAWIIPTAAILIWLVCIGWPAAASVHVLLTDSGAGVRISGAGELLLLSTGWAMAIAGGAMIIGWAPGRLLGSILGTRHSVLGTLFLAPIVLPAYIIFFAWWQAWAPGNWPGSGVFRWAVENNQAQNLRYATLLIGMWCWSWPIVAWCVAGSAANRPAWRDEVMLMVDAGIMRRIADRLRTDYRGLLVGGLIVFLATFSNTVIFDLAEIFTFGNELRAIAAIGATPSDVFTAALPATLLTAVAAIAVWFLLAAPREGQLTALHTRPPHRANIIGTSLLWIISVALPLILMAMGMRAAAAQRGLAEQINEFFTFYGRGLGNGIIIALITGAIAAIIAIGLTWLRHDRRAWVRGLGQAQAIGWIIAAAVPGTMVGAALIAAYNRPGLDDLVYLQPAVLVIGHAARFGIIAALLARWAAMAEPSELRDLRALDGADRFMPLLRATWPRLIAAGGASFAIVLVLSLSEIPVTAHVCPPGFDVITPSILNDMHYQRPQTVMLAAIAFIGAAVIAAGATMAVWRAVRR